MNTATLDIEKKLKVMGYTTDYNTCDCCGKTELKGTVTVLCLLTDTILHYGSTCAYNANKYDTLDAANEAKREVRALLNQHKVNIQNAGIMSWRYLKNKYGTTLTEDRAHRPNCSDAERNECFERALKHITTPETRFKPFTNN